MLSVNSFTQTDHGTLTLNDDGSFDYRPDDGYTGQDSFQYVASDATGNLSEPVNVALNVEHVNRAPVAGNDVFYVDALPGSFHAFDVLANDHDPDGSSLTIIGVSNSKNGGYATYRGQTLKYFHPNGEDVVEDSLTYTIEDADGARRTATFTIRVGEPPIINSMMSVTAEAEESDSNVLQAMTQLDNLDEYRLIVSGMFDSSNNTALQLTDLMDEHSGLEELFLGNSSQDLIADVQSVIALTNNSNTLKVTGDDSDTIQVSGWQDEGQQDVDGETYQVLTQSGATLLVEPEIDIITG